MLTPGGDVAQRRRLFLIVLGFLLFQCVFLIADRRLPLGHETLTRYALQYTFMNCGAQEGTIPLWLPYATQGTPSNWAWFEQGTFLQNALLLVAPLFRGAGFLPLFHLGMLLEELLFLVGVWLLASKHFPSPTTVFFVSVSAVGSSLWMDHAAQNFFSISALPMVLVLIHEILETGSRTKVVLLGVLLVVQALGKPPAFALIVPGAAALYWAGLLLFSGDPLRSSLRQFAWNRRDWLRAAGPPILLLVVLGFGAFAGARDLVYADPAGRFTGQALLSGAGLENPFQVLDFALGFSPNLDATFFSGYLTPAFALLALVRMERRSCLYLLAFLFAGLLFLSALTLLLAMTLPIPFPARAPVQGIPLVRLLVVFLAGFGFQRMVEDRFQGSGAPRRVAALLVLFCVLQGTLSGGSMDNWAAHAQAGWRVLTFRSPPEVVLPLLQGLKMFVELTGISALMAALAALTLMLWSSRSRHVPLALGLVLLVHPLDVFGWKIRMDWLKSRSLSPAAVETQKLSGLSFAPRRVSDGETDRSRKIRTGAPEIASYYGAEITYGVDSWLNESLWFADLPASRAPAQYWSASVDRLLRALASRPPSPGERPPSPWNSGTALKLAGLSRDKLRFFLRTHVAPSEQIASALSRRDFAGDLLFVEGPSGIPLPAPDRDEHLDLSYEVLDFKANSLRVAVDAAPEGAWMSFADAWHPSWTAEVNGRPAPVLRANLAYKAVQLTEGRNIVEFRFRSPLRTLSSLVLAVLSFLGIVWLLREVSLLAWGRRS